MTRNKYLDPVLCVHGFPVGVLRTGEPRCPVCRRVYRAAPPPARPPRPRHTQPMLDVAMLAAGDDTHTAEVIPLAPRRNRRDI